MTYDTINDAQTIAGEPIDGKAKRLGEANVDVTINDATTMRGVDSTLGHIDQYELVRELGGGGFGTVYLAKDTVAGIEVAVKGLPPIIRNNADELERIRENFALVSRLHHPYIAAALHLQLAREVHYASEDVRQKLRVMPGDTLMVMEYAPGVTLSKWRKQFPGGKVPLEQAIQLVWQVAQALDYAHEQHILHRDVKPSNIMVETKPDGEVVARLLDFGLAAEIRSSMGRVSREIRDTSGTRPYMAPEQWEGRKQGPATDQYALAVLLCELLTGEVPFASVFETGDPVVMMTAICNREVELPEGCPRQAALSRALAKEPSQRFSSCMEFIESAAKSDYETKPPSVSRSGAEAQGDVNGRAETVRHGAPTAPRPDSNAAGRARSPSAPQGGSRFGAAMTAVAVALVLVGGYFGWMKYDEGIKSREAESVRQKAAAEEVKRKAEERVRQKAVAEEAKRKTEAEARERAEKEAYERERRAKRRGAHDTVQLWEGGPYWATMNIGAEKPWDYGYYFWWGDIVGYKWKDTWVSSDGLVRVDPGGEGDYGYSTFKYTGFSKKSTRTYGKNDSVLKSNGWITADGTLALEHDAAYVHWGRNWRMPTKQELEDLCTKCDWTWTTTNGVNGYVVRGKDNYASNSIFLPCAGFGDEKKLYAGLRRRGQYYARSDGNYWSSVPRSDSSDGAWGLNFHSSDHYTRWDYRNYGWSVRPVQRFSK